jgi:hypothetical protein
MKVEKKSVDDINKKLESLKRKKEDGNKYGSILVFYFIYLIILNFNLFHKLIDHFNFRFR